MAREETLNIREAKPDDVGPMRAIYAPFIEHGAVSFEEEVPSEEAFGERVRSYQEELPWLVATDGDDVLGYAYAGKHRARGAYRWSVEVSVYVGPSARRRGVARSLYTSLFALLRLQSRYRALAGMTMPNEASFDFHRSMGFEPLGTYEDIGFKQGQWHSTQWLSLALIPAKGEPLAIRSPSELLGSDEWGRALQRGALDPIDEQLSRFECCEFDGSAFTHEQHVRTATAMASRYPFPVALERMRAGIQRLNQTHGVVTTDTRGYHETLTRAWLAVVFGELRRCDLDGEDRLGEVAKRLADKHSILRHYSKDKIMSREARYGWAEPDLEPLPQLPHSSATMR